MATTLREEISLVKFIEDAIREYGYENESTKEWLINLKKKIRRKLKPHTVEVNGGILVNRLGDWDWCISKYFYPGVHWTEEEKREYKEYNWIESPNSPYDCTGKIFTCWIQIFDVPKGTIVYIRENMDV